MGENNGALADVAAAAGYGAGRGGFGGFGGDGAWFLIILFPWQAVPETTTNANVSRKVSKRCAESLCN